MFDLPPEDAIFGRSAAMGSIRRRLGKVSGTNVPILIEGEGGTGKEVLARWIHSISPWSSGPFIKVNCAAIPATLLESELFGHEKGAFTGAYHRKLGRIELAQHGSLFLDEIAELHPGMQPKLLQFLQDGRFSRIGDQAEQRVETRVICATNRDLEREVQRGSFRIDLFYRINVVKIHMPPLRERLGDVLLLTDYFLSRYGAQFERIPPAMPEKLRDDLENCAWHGNIRELENRIARYVILGVDDDPKANFEAPRGRRARLEVSSDGSIPLKRIAKQAVRETESNLILKALRENRWTRRKAAQVLNISYRALIYKIQEAGLGQKNGRKGQDAPESGPNNAVERTE